MKEIITAKEFVTKFTKEYGMYDDWLKDIMIEFAKLHVQAALEAAANSKIANPNGIVDIFSSNLKSVIKNAYSLENIK